MNESLFISLIHNCSLLLAMALVFDMISFRVDRGEASIRQIIPGIILSIITVSVMLSPWKLAPGLVFDTRSIATSMTGLFFGFIPSVIVMASASALRLYQGGDGAITGTLVILATCTTGLAWRHTRKGTPDNISMIELYIFGIIVHIIMLLLMFTLPKNLAFRVLPAISAPVMLIYPAGTALLGSLFVNRIRRENRNRETESQKDELHRKSILLNETQKLTKVGGWEYDNSTAEMQWTDEVYRIHGISPVENKEDKKKLAALSVQCYEPSDRETIFAAFRKCATEGIPYDMEFQFTDLNGTKKWIRTTANPAYKNGVITGALGNIMDITDLKEGALTLEKSVKEKELLMRELQHRVKNNLNIVSGIIRLGEMNISDEGSKRIFTEARNRISAISSIYEKLYQSPDISSVELHLYLNGLIDSLMSTYSTGHGSITLVKELNSCTIDLKRGVPIGLLVNELVTNALKHAFPGGRNGILKVKLTCDDGFISVSVEDNGAGFPPEVISEDGGNMGLTLVRMLAEQIGGELVIENDNGARITVSIDMRNSL